jgi:CRISPR-associated endonuclease Csn1
VGYTGHKSAKYAEAQSGTNLFFAIYADSEGKRSYRTIPLNVVIERMKQDLPPASEFDENGNALKFTLSPNDLVYVPTEDEIQAGGVDVSNLDKDRIYKFINSSKIQALFVPHRLASPLLALKKEIDPKRLNNVVHEVSLGNSLGKIECIEINGEKKTIKSVCWKLEVNRLGEISKIIR